MASFATGEESNNAKNDGTNESGNNNIQPFAVEESFVESVGVVKRNS